MKRYWHWGTKIALVYGLFVMGTMTMVVIAVGQRTDLVAPDYYARALRQDERMVALGNAAALGTSFRADQSGPDRLVVQWPHTPEGGVITMYRASDADADRTVPIVPTTSEGGTRQEVTLASFQRGAWRAQIAWTAQGKSYYAEREITIK